MHLLIDGQAMQTPESRHRGIGRFARNLVAGLAAVRPGWHLEVIQSGHLPPIEPLPRLQLEVRTFHPPLPVTVPSQEANERYYGDWLTAQAPRAILIPSFFERSGVVPRFTGPHPPLFGVLHDLIPLIFHDRYLTHPELFTDYCRRLRQMLAADCMLANSESTARDLRQFFGAEAPHVVTIGGASDPTFVPLSRAALECQRRQLFAKLGLERDFLLYVGGFDYRKNLIGALLAFAALPEAQRLHLDLVLACELTPADRSFLEQVGRMLGISRSLKLTGYVTDAELRTLYQLCRLFIFPSLYEGLGFPVLEALQCGAPVVASDRASVPEYAGPMSWLADPASPQRQAEAILAALAQPREHGRQERIQHALSFGWEKSAERAARALEAPRPVRPGSRRRRLAWFSPLPPARSGIADYSAELLDSLRQDYDIELVVDPTQPLVAAKLAGKHRVLRASSLAARHDACPFDLFVYHVGNSTFHTYMLHWMRRFRGLVVLHDYYLSGLVTEAIWNGVWPATLAEELAFDGEGELAHQLQVGRVDPWEARQRAALNRRILSTAEAILVHSAWSWKQLRQFVRVPVARIPLFMEAPPLKDKAQERARLGLPADKFVLATLGLVGPPKRIPSLFRAVAALAPAIRQQTLLLVVGETPPGYHKELRALAEQLDLASLARFIGRVNLEDFAIYGRAVDVCVQLRYPTRGESSAALLRALAAGAACVISDHGPMAEIPDTIAHKVRTPEHEVEDLTAALTHLYAHPEVRTALGEAAQRHVAAHYSLRKAIVPRYAAFIDEVIAQRAARDALWSECTVEALVRSSDPAAAQALIEPWAVLRLQAQRAVRAAAAHDAPSSQLSGDPTTLPSTGPGSRRAG